MRKLIVAAAIATAFLSTAQAQLAIGVATPSVSIGINMPVYPQLVRIPGYPVYYDPRANGNYFFYDGLFWVFIDDNWYSSQWYDGPWHLVMPEYVPLYILRVPVRYYVRPPVWFRGWTYSAPPRWGEHWGHDWERRREGWDHWDRRAVPAPAPLPRYQQQFRGDRYPHSPERQEAIRDEHYRYQPREQRFAQPQPRVQQAPPQMQPPVQPQPHAQPQPYVQPQPHQRVERAPQEQQRERREQREERRGGDRRDDDQGGNGRHERR